MTRVFVRLYLVLGLLGWQGTACTSSTPPTSTFSSPATPSPVSTETPATDFLTDADAMVLVKEELAARGVDPDTVRVRFGGAPRWVSVRYSSAYRYGGSVFKAQSVLVALAVSRVAARVRPSVDGGIRLAVIPGGESNAGLDVTTIDGANLEAWAAGAISDQEFVGEWTVGTVTTE